MGPINLYGKILRISNDLSSEASGPVFLKVHVEPPYVGANEILLKWLQFVDRNIYIYDKNKQHLNIFFRSEDPWGCIFAQIIGGGRSTKLLKWWSDVYIWPFYDTVKFASLCFCMGPIHLYGKMLKISNDFSSKAAGPAQISFGASLG